MNYIFKKKYPEYKNFTIGFKEILKQLNLSYSILNLSTTRYPYDDSDNTSWVLIYNKNLEHLKADKIQLANIKFQGKPVFTIKDNGYNTGIDITLNVDFEPTLITE